jgi:hypothetical protein
MKLPDYPIPNEPVRASWGRQIVDYLRSITPRSSSSVLVSTTANGTTLRSTASSRRGAGGSFSGRAWVGAFPKIIVDRSEDGATQYCSIRHDGTGYDWVEEMPDQQPADATVFDLDNTYGDIHLPGNIAP